MKPAGNARPDPAASSRHQCHLAIQAKELRHHPTRIVIPDFRLGPTSKQLITWRVSWPHLNRAGNLPRDYKSIDLSRTETFV
jgi:hypothetical protein